MVSLSRIGLITAVLLAAFLQLPLVRRLVTAVRLNFGIGTTIQPIGDFEPQCRRIHDVRLQACEDMWLSEATRQLFLACSEAGSRSQWMPSEGGFNLTGRPTKDAVIVMDVDTLDIRLLPMDGFTGTADDGIINLTGFTGLDKEDGSIELFITNFRPSIELSTGQVALDQARVGSNATIEVFKTGPKPESLEHVRTLVDPVIASPNRIAAVEGQGLYISNDHGQRKTGLVKAISPILRTGDVAFCPDGPASSCEIVSTGHGYPNGLWHSSVDHHIYLPCSAEDRIKVLKPGANGSLEVIDKIDFPYSVDNLSQDKNGILWAAVLPRPIELMKQSRAPLTHYPPSSVFKILRASNGTFEVVKVVEDRDGEILPGTTTVVHDATTGNLFLSGMVTNSYTDISIRCITDFGPGVFSPFISICEGVH